MGLREKKKARTRKLISDVALQLFLEKGYAAVTVAEIADRAEVAVATLFNYYSSKESIVFDREEEFEEDIVAAVRKRGSDEKILDALHDYFLSSRLFEPQREREGAQFMQLVHSTPELNAYFRAVWDRYGEHLADAIVETSVVPRAEADCLARLVIEAVSFACHAPSPIETLNLAFRILRQGCLH